VSPPPRTRRAAEEVAPWLASCSDHALEYQHVAVVVVRVTLVVVVVVVVVVVRLKTCGCAWWVQERKSVLVKVLL